MISTDEIQTARAIIEVFLQRMTMRFSHVSIVLSSVKNKQDEQEDMLTIAIELEEPQFLIGQNGQMLSEFQRILRIMLNKKLQKSFYVDLDINSYKKKKVEHLKRLAQNTADEVVVMKEKRVLPPMSAFERRIVHMELASRKDVVTESQGEGFEKTIVISPVA